MFDVKRLLVLRTAAAHGSFSAAADVLSYTQSAVSQQIAALEREAGTLLVERTSRGIRLTEAGRVLVEHADVILARLERARDEIDAITELRGGRLRLISFPSAGATIVPKAIAAFRAKYPDVELTLEPEEPLVGLQRLRAGECDIALTVEAPDDDFEGDGLTRLALLDDPFHVALPVGHDQTMKPAVDLADLAHETWMVGSTGSCPDGRIFLRVCHEAGFEPRVAFHSDDYSAIQGFVAAGVGIALIPNLVLATARKDIAICSLGENPPFRRIVAATLEDAANLPAIQAMHATLQRASAKLGAKSHSARR